MAPTPALVGHWARCATGLTRWAWPSGVTSRAPCTTTRGSSLPLTSGIARARPCRVMAGSSRWATAPSTSASASCRPSGTTSRSTPATCSRSSPAHCPSTGRSTRPGPSPHRPAADSRWQGLSAPRPGRTGWWWVMRPARSTPSTARASTMPTRRVAWPPTS